MLSGIHVNVTSSLSQLECSPSFLSLIALNMFCGCLLSYFIFKIYMLFNIKHTTYGLFMVIYAVFFFSWSFGVLLWEIATMGKKMREL